MSPRALGCLLTAVVGLVGCYIEPVEETGCQDATFRLTCRQLDDRIAILEASFSSNWTAADGNASACDDGSWDWDAAARPAGPFNIRPSLNYRCSGMNHCSFILTADHKPSADWGPGIVSLKYACFNKDHMTKFCNEEISVKDEGFVMSPGYPGYYVHQNDCYWLLRATLGQRLQLSLLDMSLRGLGEPGGNCTDRLQVIEDDHVLLTECGELDKAAVVVSDSSMLNITLTGLTQNIYPKRGILFHYKAVGCPNLVAPEDGYTVYKNETDAQFMCCVDYMFPDTRQRVRNLHCVKGNTWNTSLPDCITDSTMQTLGREGNPPPTVVPLHSTTTNTTSHTAAIIKESDFIVDVILPTMIICTLIIGNGVILFVIFYLRKRKSPESGDEEELGEIYQPHDGSISDKAISV